MQGCRVREASLPPLQAKDGPPVHPAASTVSNLILYTGLGREVQEVLDRRKLGGMSEGDRKALVEQLLGLVALLEEELFQAEAQKFEAEVRTITPPT